MSKTGISKTGLTRNNCVYILPVFLVFPQWTIAMVTLRTVICLSFPMLVAPLVIAFCCFSDRTSESRSSGHQEVFTFTDILGKEIVPAVNSLVGGKYI